MRGNPQDICVAHESALRGGELMDIPDFGPAPADWEKIDYEPRDNHEDTSKYYELDTKYPILTK